MSQQPHSNIRTRSLALVALALIVLAAGCSDCETKCVGPHAIVRVGKDLAGVEVCDIDAVCTRQQFGPSADSVVSRSFQIVTPDSGKSITLQIRGFDDNGTEVVADEATADVSNGSCGCAGPAEFAVDATGVQPAGDD